MLPVLVPFRGRKKLEPRPFQYLLGDKNSWWASPTFSYGSPPPPLPRGTAMQWNRQQFIYGIIYTSVSWILTTRWLVGSLVGGTQKDWNHTFLSRTSKYYSKPMEILHSPHPLPPGHDGVRNYLDKLFSTQVLSLLYNSIKGELGE